MTTEIYEIRQLLNLYYGGIATLEDEKRLCSLLESATLLPDDLVRDRDIILSLKASRAPEIPAGMAADLMRLVDRLEYVERRKVRGHQWIAFSGIAVSLAIVISIVMFIARNGSPNPHEITDLPTAFNETERALMMVSESLNKTGDFFDETNSAIPKITLIDDTLCDEDYDSLLEDSLYEDSLYNDQYNDTF